MSCKHWCPPACAVWWVPSRHKPASGCCGAQQGWGRNQRGNQFWVARGEEGAKSVWGTGGGAVRPVQKSCRELQCGEQRGSGEQQEKHQRLIIMWSKGAGEVWQREEKRACRARGDVVWGAGRWAGPALAGPLWLLLQQRRRGCRFGPPTRRSSRVQLQALHPAARCSLTPLLAKQQL